MTTETVRVSAGTHSALKELSALTGQPMTVVLDRAVEAYQREQFLDECDRAYSRLRADPKAWREELAERALWDVTLADGLEDD
jgi:hypothetical protein